MRVKINPGKQRRSINFIDNIVYSHVHDLQGNPMELTLSLMVQNGNCEMRLASGRDDEVSTGKQPLVIWINGAGWRGVDKNLMAAEMEFLAEAGAAGLPLILVDGEAVVAGRYPAWEEWRIWLGIGGGCGRQAEGCAGCRGCGRCAGR